MANSQEDDVRARGSLAGSEEALILPAEPRRGSNSRAFKVAGLTTLACLLLASQVFTAYFVFNQKQQIHTLQQNSEKMSRQLTRSSQAVPMRRQMPMLSHPLMKDFTLDEDVKTITPTKPPVIDPVVSVEKQVKDLMQESQLPQFNETFLANLQSLQQQLNESDWKSFESWMRYWLIFQMAQQKPAPPTTKPAPVVKTDCQIEAAHGVGKIGSYKPQCDEQGRYKPMQCWHSTGFCWCVDERGTVIEGTSIRGRPDCPRDGAAAPYRMMLAAAGPIEQILSTDDQ